MVFLAKDREEKQPELRLQLQHVQDALQQAAQHVGFKNMKKIKIGTRGSVLALWQAEWVKSEIEKQDKNFSVELVIIKTKGDKILDVPLAKVGGKGLFVKEIEDAILDGRVDMAVHSMKDVPAEIPEGLFIKTITKRENPYDVLVSKNGETLSKLPQGAKIGTSSLRRSSQILHLRPDIQIVPLRGNLDTRLKKLETENMDAIILAAAGIHRLGFQDKITQYIKTDEMLPAVGQGALGIEVRKNDPQIISIVEKMNDPETHIAVIGERAFLHEMSGSCQVPIAAFATISGSEICLEGMVAQIDGSTLIKEKISGPTEDAQNLGKSLAKRILDLGAKEILDSIEIL